MKINSVIKERINSTTSMRYLLIKDLKTLRKGNGLTSRKLHEATELRNVIAERLNLGSDASSIGQVTNYLIQEFNNLGENIEARATRNAFGIGWEHNPYNLLKRRTDFSSQLKRHPDTIETYENQGIEELVFRLINMMPTSSINYTDAKAVTLSQLSTNIQPERVMNAAQNMIAQGLGDVYSLGAHAPEILKYFGSNQSPYLETNMEWFLLPSKKGKGWFSYKFRYTFRGQRKNYKVGIVTNAHDGELLMNSGLVDDILTLLNIQDLKNEVLALLNQTHFMFHDQDTGLQHVLQFTEMDESSRQELLSLIWQLDNNAIKIIEVEIPKNGQRSGTLYEYRHSFDIPINVHFAYWYAPGLMYLNNLLIDVSHFPNRDTWEFFIQPFLGLLSPTIVKPTGGRYLLATNGWIMQGHGVALVWRKAEIK